MIDRGQQNWPEVYEIPDVCAVCGNESRGSVSACCAAEVVQPGLYALKSRVDATIAELWPLVNKTITGEDDVELERRKR